MTNTKGSDWKEEFDELIRDITRVGFIAKSEARRRIELIVLEAYQQGKEEERERVRIKLAEKQDLEGIYISNEEYEKFFNSKE